MEKKVFVYICWEGEMMFYIGLNGLKVLFLML